MKTHEDLPEIMKWAMKTMMPAEKVSGATEAFFTHSLMTQAWACSHFERVKNLCADSYTRDQVMGVADKVQESDNAMSQDQRDSTAADYMIRMGWNED